MLNVFPNLLDYTFFAPTLLRIAAALVFFWLAYAHLGKREQLAQTNFPIIGRSGSVLWIAVVVELLVGLSLLFGAWTQVGALIGALAALKYSIWWGKYPAYFVLPRAAALLLLLICLSLMLTGAGAYAFDVPL